MKQSEIIQLSIEDLNERLLDEEKTFVELKLAHRVTPIENPMLLRTKRKTIARIKTELRKREIQG